MNVGNKILCIKELHPYLLKSKIYKIIDISVLKITISSQQKSLTLSCDEEEFHEYFITLKKHRKLKLEKLNIMISKG